MIFIWTDIGGAIYGIEGRSFNDCWGTAVYAREIANNSGFQPIWTTNQIYIPTDELSSPLFAGKAIYFFGTTDACQTMAVAKIDLATGAILDNDVIPLPSHNGIAMVYSPDHIFIGHHGTGKAIDSSLEGAGGIMAYDIDQEVVSWREIISGTRQIQSLFANSHQVAIDSDFARRYYLLDSQTGAIVETYATTGPYYQAGGNMGFWFSDDKSTPAVDFWAARLSNVWQNPVILADGDMLIRTREGHVQGQIKRIDSQTGDTIWELNQLVLSNVVASPSAFFYLSPSAELIAADLNTGQTIASVTFTPAQVQLGEDRGFYVATNESNQIFVYFGDSRQLFAFQFTPPPNLETE
ncbi:MAG: hypothetical protein OT477_17690 [Chloroflexi bacterium]|nr:hypothetical protein [Chloroflexota bacterium]